MKFLEKIIAPKALTMIHTLVCFALIVALFLLSFGTIFTLEVGSGDVTEAVDDLIDEIENAAGEEIDDIVVPESIDVSFPFIVKSVAGGVKAAGALIEILKDTAEDVKSDYDDLMETKEDIENLQKDPLSADQDTLNDLMEEKETATNTKEVAADISDVVNQDLINLICFVIAIITAFQANFIVGLCYALILFVVIMVPISCIFNALICIISMLKNLKNPGKAFHRVAKSFSSIIKKFPLVLLVVALVPEVKLGGALTGMFAVIIAGLVFSLIVSRLKSYEKPDFKYINILQIFSLASLIAFIVFFTNMAKTHIMNAFFSQSGNYIAGEVGSLLADKKQIDFVPFALIAVFVVVLMLVCSYLVKIATRLACMSSSKKDTHIFTTAIGLALVAIPFVLMNIDFKLELGEAEMSAFMVSSVAVVLMFVIEIVLKAVVAGACHDVPAARRKEIVTGAYIHEAHKDIIEEIAAEVADDTVAEEAVAEEAVAEEAVAEEAVAEEAVAEEAVAEEAVAEEPAEEAEKNTEEV